MAHLFLSNNRVISDGASYSVTTGSEHSSYPIENIAETFTTKVFRSTGNTCVFVVDTGHLNTWDTFAIVGSAIDGLGFTSLKLRMSPTNSFSGDYITVNLSQEYNVGFVTFTSGSFRFLEVTAEGGGDFCEFSNLYIGEATSLSDNFINSNSFKYQSLNNADVKTNNYGNKFITTYSSLKQLIGNMEYLNASEFETLRNLFNYHNVSLPLFVIIDPTGVIGTDTEYIFSGYFYFRNNPADFSSVNGNYWNTIINLIEAR